MRLAELKIEGFGILNDFYLGREDLGEGLNLVYGRNEAGKSTLMGFIRSILLGFKVKGWTETPALRGGRLGGHLVLLDDAGREYRIERYQTGKKDSLQVDPDLASAIEGLTPAVYRNILAFDVDELRRFDELSQLEVSAYLYGAGTGVAADKLTTAISGLKKEMEELFKPSGKNPRLNQLALEIHRLDREISELQHQHEEFSRFGEREAGLEREWYSLTEEQRRLETEVRRLEEMKRSREILDEIEALQRQLAELPPMAGFPVNGLERYSQLVEERKNLPTIAAPSLYSLEDRENALSDLEFNLRRLESLDGEEAHLAKRREDLARQNEMLEAEQSIAPIVPLWAGGLLIGLMAVLTWFAFLNYPGFGAVTLVVTLALGVFITVSGVRTSRGNARRREANRQSSEYLKQQLEQVGKEIQKAKEAREDYQGYNRKLFPVALGMIDGTWEDINRGMLELNREKEVRQRGFYIEKELAALMKAAGAGDDEEFRQKADAERRIRDTRKRIETCEDRLLVISQRQEGELEKLKQDLASLDRVSIEEATGRHQEGLAAVSEGLKRVGEELGALRGQKKSLETSDRLAEKTLEREMRQNTLEQVAGRWQVCCLCRQLIEMAKERHEQNRQPEVMRLASRFFEEMTAGGYRRVVATVGRPDQIEVETADGARKPVKALSRGTLFQLYLSVRLALAQMYPAVKLPIILDEVLVDFDRERLEGALRVLRQVAGERQVIYFTCHQHVVEAVGRVFDRYRLIKIEEVSGAERGV